MRLKKGAKKIVIVRGKGISFNLNTIRCNIKSKFKFSTLVEADEFIASEIQKIISK